LPSWNDGPTKSKILTFVERVTTARTTEFVPPPERVAVFDNDGTLWCEHPLPVQGFFVFDRIEKLVRERPELREKPAFRAVADHDRAALAKLGKRDLVELMIVTHSGMTTDEFSRVAGAWLEDAKHPRFARPFTACAFQPMLELLALLERNGFENFVVSGGGVDFIRAFAERTYGISPERVIGSSGKTRVAERGGKLVVEKLPELGSFDDREGKVQNIELHIGRRPIFAFGNSDGDLAMLRYTTEGAGARLALLLHHDDDEREVAYDRTFAVSPLEQGLELARERGWLVSMKRDFRRVFAD
jgi:phosphoglycolate phosphatase-like HAD superfamily hydrolase